MKLKKYKTLLYATNMKKVTKRQDRKKNSKDGTAKKKEP